MPPNTATSPPERRETDSPARDSLPSERRRSTQRSQPGDDTGTSKSTFTGNRERAASTHRSRSQPGGAEVGESAANEDVVSEGRVTRQDRELQQVTAHYERIIAEKDRAYRELARTVETTSSGDAGVLRTAIRRTRDWLARR